MEIRRQAFINVGLIIIAICITIVICHYLFNRFVSNNNGTRTTAEKLVLTHPLFKNYTQPETDFKLPLYTASQGSDCVKVIRTPNEMHYSAYFGWNTQQLDVQCAKKHLARPGIRTIYFGGSAMENFEAPNYLTKIDNYVNKLIPTIVSLNLAESGGRSTNNLVRLMIEAIDLPADYWVFLDGFNEFNAIKYGGDYNQDYYWTAVVNDRIHKPIKSVFDKLIAKSPLAQRLFYATGFINNPRVLRKIVTDQDIYAAADYYIENIKKISMLCENKKVRCLFFLQPYLRAESSKSTYILDTGYAYILSKLGNKVIDLRPQFEGVTDALVDEVHYSKKGSELIANSIAEQILKADF